MSACDLFLEMRGIGREAVREWRREWGVREEEKERERETWSLSISSMPASTSRRLFSTDTL